MSKNYETFEEWSKDDEFEEPSDQEKAQEMFTLTHKIPLIRFSRNPHTLIDTLNSLLNYATILASDKDFGKYHRGDPEKLQAYTMKIEEGLRLGKSLEMDEFSKTELLRIEKEINSIDNKKGKSAEKSAEKKDEAASMTNTLKSLGICAFIFILYLIFKACR